MTSAPSKPNRLPWIIAGVLGCLVVCLLLVVGVTGIYILFGPGRGPVANVPVTSVTRAPFGLNPTSPAAPAVNQTQAPVAATVVTGSTSVAPTAATLVTTPTLPAAPTAAVKAAATATAVPKGKIAFSVCSANCDQDDNKTLWIVNADGSGLKKIGDKATEPTFSPDGSQIAYYHWSDGIYVMSADGSGAPGKKIVGDTMVGFIEWSHDGRLIAFSAQPGGKGNIAVDVVTPDGKDRHNLAIGQSPSWSPDDTQIVFDTCRGSDCGIFKGGSGGGDATPIVIDGGGLPAWSPDGKKIVYQTEIDGQKQVFSINPDGSGKKQLTSGGAMHVSPAWSADGKYIYYRTPEGGSWGIWRMNADGSGPVKLIGDVPPVNAGRERIAITR